MIRRPLVFFAIVFAIVSIGILLTPYDDTDPPDGRSGMRLFSDHLTGCQYVSAGLFGGLTPRLDRDGKPMCGVRQ